jgi:hypothetical protein
VNETGIVIWRGGMRRRSGNAERRRQGKNEIGDSVKKRGGGGHGNDAGSREYASNHANDKRELEPAVEKQSHHRTMRDLEKHEEPPELGTGAAVKEVMRRRLKTAEGKKIYKKRKETAEYFRCDTPEEQAVLAEVYHCLRPLNNRFYPPVRRFRLDFSF